MSDDNEAVDPTSSDPSADDDGARPMSSDSSGRGWRETRWLAWVPVGVLIVGALGLFGTGAIFGHDPKATGRVTLDEIVVRNARYDSDDVGLHGQQTIGSSPTVDLTLLNSTREPVLIEQAKVFVLGSTPVPLCYAQGGGDVPADAPETIALPRAGDVPAPNVTRALHHFVPAHGLERFLFRFNAEGLMGEDYAIYHLKVVLTTSADQTLDSGEVVIAAPAAIPRTGAYLPEDDALLKQASTGPHLDTTWCFRHNVSVIRQASGWAGKRAPETRQLASFEAAPRWPRFQDRTPPRRAARELLHKEVFHIEESVYAAEATHDPTFIRYIKSRASHLLVADARSNLRGRYPQGAIDSLLRAKALKDSAEVDELLQQARSLLARRHGA